MRWEKLGLIFDPAILQNKKLSAALMPIAEIIDLESDIVRVYYAPRDEHNRSELHFFEMRLGNKCEVTRLSSGPLFQKGKRGCFDDSGITPGSIVRSGDKVWYYYTGWNLTQSVPFNNSIGIAELGKDGLFHRLGDGPVMTRSLHEPNSCASPFVMFENDTYRMWYASMDRWEDRSDGLRHHYNIKYAESKDGINWNRRGQVAINYENESEYAFGRPFVLKEGGLYKMWYAFRGEFYRIGYAESRDGFQWTRRDREVGIDVSPAGWDSEMIEYPFLFDHKGTRYMMYNGNGYGKSGIGLARLLP